MPRPLSLALLALAGCTEVPYIPTEPPALGSAGDTGDTGEGDIPCSVDRAPLTEATFTVINGSAGDAELLWRAQNCGESVYAWLSAGESYTQQSIVGHVWLLRDDLGELIGWFELTEPGPTTVEVN